MGKLGMYCYVKKVGEEYHIHEKGETYIGMRRVKSDRPFKDWNNEVLTFPHYGHAFMFCISRNSILN